MWVISASAILTHTQVVLQSRILGHPKCLESKKKVLKTFRIKKIKIKWLL